MSSLRAAAEQLVSATSVNFPKATRTRILAELAGAKDEAEVRNVLRDSYPRIDTAIANSARNSISALVESAHSKIRAAIGLPSYRASPAAKPAALVAHAPPQAAPVRVAPTPKLSAEQLEDAETDRLVALISDGSVSDLGKIAQPVKQASQASGPKPLTAEDAETEAMIALLRSSGVPGFRQEGR